MGYSRTFFFFFQWSFKNATNIVQATHIFPPSDSDFRLQSTPPCIPLLATTSSRSVFSSLHRRSTRLLIPLSSHSCAMSGLEHEIAIDISRALNLINPNDLLARQVIQIARNHKQAQGFVKGMGQHTRSCVKGSSSFHDKRLPLLNRNRKSHTVTIRPG